MNWFELFIVFMWIGVAVEFIFISYILVEYFLWKREFKEKRDSKCEPSAPILEGLAAKEFLNIIEQNKNKKVPKEDFDRAKKAFKNFEVI
jgi:hypothetical protein